MRCSICRGLLDDYLRGYLDQPLNSEIANHLAVCNDCAAEYESHKDLLAILKHEPELVIDKHDLADFVPGVWQKIESRNSISWTSWLYKLAAPVLTALVLTLIILNPMIDITPYRSEVASLENNYTEDGYYALINMMFSDEDLEVMNLIENDLFSDGHTYYNEGYSQYLEGLSDEGLNMIDEKLNKLLNNAG